MKQIIIKFILIIFTGICLNSTEVSAQDQPNILLIISDDLGVDATNGYHENPLMPTTPTLDSLRSVGITFENVFSAPVCSPTRAAIMSGKYGIKSGVTGLPGHLELEHTSVFKALEEQTNGAYADAVIGKWHLAQGMNLNHPQEHGVDYYSGVINGAVSDYFAWNQTENGSTNQSTEYVTSALTDKAIEWVDNQTQPWFLWLAHVSPHTPLHVPPEHLYTIANTDNDFRKYVAMIEAMDSEIGRLINSMSEAERENTLIIYVGDNGTPNGVLRNYPNGHGKGFLYQGGIRVPMIVAGKGVERKGVRESALIHVADIHATILESAGTELSGGLFNSLSFDHLFSGANGATRTYNFSDSERNGNYNYAIRNDRYKLITFADEPQEMYDLLLDSLEFDNLLLSPISAELELIKADLEQEANQSITAWSCRDFIQNGDEENIDCGGSFCAPCVTATKELLSEGSSFDLTPNPSNGIIYIKNIDENIADYNISISDKTGQVFRRINKKAMNKHMSIDISDLSEGIYFVTYSSVQETITKKLYLVN